MNLFLVRHGESVGNVNQLEYFKTEDSKIPLTSKGRTQSHLAGREILDKLNTWCQPTLVVNSPYLRTSQTADEICKVFQANKSFMFTRAENPLLYERSWGALRDLVKNRKHTKDDFSFFSRPANGESFADVYTRVSLFFNSYINQVKHIHKTIIVVTHGEWMRVADMYLSGTTVAEFDAVRDTPANCEIKQYVLLG